MSFGTIIYTLNDVAQFLAFLPTFVGKLPEPNSTVETNSAEKQMHHFNRMIDKLRLLPIKHIDKVSTPGEIGKLQQKVDKFNELIQYLNLLSSSRYRLKAANASLVTDETNWFLQQLKALEFKLNDEIETYDMEGNTKTQNIIKSVTEIFELTGVIILIITRCFYIENSKGWWYRKETLH